MITLNRKQPAPWRRAIVELSEQGLLNKDELIVNLVNWLSEADAKEFCKSYELPVKDDRE